MKIIGFTQLRNELEKGNLENWFKCMLPICNYIYIFDNNSTDGSLEYYKKFDNVVVIESSTNRFHEEMVCKSELLEMVKSDHPDTDWIFWMDGDTLLDNRLLENNGQGFRDLCESLKGDSRIGMYRFGHKNLWRSDIYWRNDNSYNVLDGGVCPLWRYNPNIYFNKSVGLHLQSFPYGLGGFKVLPYTLIHRGFSTDDQILNRYELYKSRGQSGWELERFLDEKTLEVFPLDDGLLPEWFIVTDDINPKEKKKLIDVYNDKK